MDNVTADPVRAPIVVTKSGKLEAPKSIVPTVSGMKSIYFQYRTEHVKRIDLYAAIEGLIAGNPPYNPGELAKNKLGYLSNFNNLDARSLFDRSAQAYWNLLNEAEYIAQFEVRGPATDEPEHSAWANTMSRHFNDVVRSWPSFHTAVNTLSGQLVKFGVSPVFWPDEQDWRWRTIELSRFFIEDQAQTDVELITCVFVETIFTVQKIYDIYETFQNKTTKGEDTTWDYTVCPWNLEELKSFLIFFANTALKSDRQIYDMMEVQRRLQNGDLALTNAFSDSVRLVSGFYQEYTGKFSHFIFHPRWDHGNFLFKELNQYNCLKEALVIFTASPGEFTIHSNRGVGHKIFSPMQAMMQLDCTIIDMARISGTPLIKSLATGSRDFEPIRIFPGVPTNIGSAEFIQNTLGANIQQLIGASQYVMTKVNYNIANSGDDPGFPDRSEGSISPSQAKMQSYREFGILKNNIAHYYIHFDMVIENMVIKMLNSKDGYQGYEYAKEWKDRCIMDGVPEELFATRKTDNKYYGMPLQLKVKATRVAGDGSTLARIMGLQEMGPYVSSLGAEGVHEYLRQMVLATMGPQYVKAFLPKGTPDELRGGASLAAVENGIMRLGESPVFSPDNDQRAHIGIHLALGNDTIQRIQQQQMTAVEADKILVVLVPHLKEHVEQVGKDILQKQFFQSIQRPYGELVQYATLNHHNAAKEIQAQIKAQQEQQAKQQQVMSDQELKTYQAQKDEERKDLKVGSQVERAKDANENRAEIMREKVQSDAGNKRLEIELKNRNKTVEEQNKALEEKPLPELRSDLAKINGVSPSPYNIE